MNIRINQVKHKNMDAILMESDALAVTVIPDSGAKIQSIVDKNQHKEILFQSKRETFRMAGYGDRFDKGDLSGFDEVFPTIDECYYPAWPWAGTLIPDHGEVWALPWEYRMEGNALILSVCGVRFPYRLEKKIEFLRDNSFRMSYRAANDSNFDLNFIWCPHPFLVCDAHTRVILPPSVKEVISTCPLENKLGAYGAIHPWPVTRTSSGESYDIADVMHPPYAGKCEKFYAVNKPLEGWCALQNILTGETIGLSYQVDKLPYLGVWEGIIDDQYITALEPVTGAYDRLDLARLADKVNILKSRSAYEWFLNLSFDTIKEIHEIDLDGCIR